MEQKKKVINKTTYLVTQMDSVKALKVQTKLIKILGAGVFSLVGKKGNVKEKVATLIPALMENFDDEFVTDFIISLFDKGVFTEEKGNPKVVEFESHFVGKPMEMWKVAAFILEANFAMGEHTESSLPTTKAENLTQEN